MQFAIIKKSSRDGGGTKNGGGREFTKGSTGGDRERAGRSGGVGMNADGRGSRGVGELLFAAKPRKDDPWG